MTRFCSLIILLVSSIGFAKIETTQTLMPAAKQSDFRFGFGYTMAEIDYSAGNAKADGVKLVGSYYYGLAEGHALFGSLNYGGVNHFSDDVQLAESSGFGTMDLGYMGRIDAAGSSSFYFGLAYSHPMEQAELTSEDTITYAPEQASTNLMLAYLLPVGAVHLGGLAVYSHKLKGTLKTLTSSVDVENGHELITQVFAELQTSLHPNLSLSHVYTGREKRTEADGSSFHNQGRGMLSLGFSVRLEPQANFQFIPAIGYEILAEGPDGIESYSSFNLAVLARLLF